MKPVTVKERAFPRSGPPDRRIRPGAADIDIRLFPSGSGRHHQLADHALDVVKEDMAVEQPAAERAAQRCAVSQRAVIEPNPDGERVVWQEIDRVPELVKGQGVHCPRLRRLRFKLTS